MGFYTVLLVIHTIIVLFLIGIILIQRSDSDGMSGLGGGGGGGGNQFLSGRSTANLLTRTTAILATAFMLTSLVLAVWANRVSNESIIDSTVMEETVAEDAAPLAVSDDDVVVPTASALAQDSLVETDTNPSVPKPE